MILDARRSEIIRTLQEDGATSVQELAKSLSVSESTIRRDLQLLDRNGELVRTYGGAVIRPRATIHQPGEAEDLENEYDSSLDHPSKAAIAKAAAALIEDETVVILDIGTTTPLIARELRGRPVTVITSNLAVLDELRSDSEARLLMLGGVLRRNYRSFVGSLTEASLAQVSADMVFLSCTGIRSNGTILDNMAVEAPIKQSMLSAATTSVLLAPARKFPGTGALRICSITDFDVVITSEGAPEEPLALVRNQGGNVIFA